MKANSLFLLKAAAWLSRLRRKVANRTLTITLAERDKPPCKIIEFKILSTTSNQNCEECNGTDN